MNKLKIIFLLFCFSLDIIAQGDKANSSDTLNFVDANGKKQGHWIIFGKSGTGNCYTTDQKVEEGKYLNNRKNGPWTQFYCNGKIKNVLTFVDGRPSGPQKLFYESGQIKEEGVWQSNHWVNDGHKKYTPDGKIDTSPDNLIKEDTIKKTKIE